MEQFLPPTVAGLTVGHMMCVGWLTVGRRVLHKGVMWVPANSFLLLWSFFHSLDFSSVYISLWAEIYSEEKFRTTLPPPLPLTPPPPTQCCFWSVYTLHLCWMIFSFRSWGESPSRVDSTLTQTTAGYQTHSFHGKHVKVKSVFHGWDCGSSRRSPWARNEMDRNIGPSPPEEFVILGRGCRVSCVVVGVGEVWWIKLLSSLTHYTFPVDGAAWWITIGLEEAGGGRKTERKERVENRRNRVRVWPHRTLERLQTRLINPGLAHCCRWREKVNFWEKKCIKKEQTVAHTLKRSRSVPNEFLSINQVLIFTPPSSECLLHLSGCGTFDPHEWLSVEAAAHTVVHCCPYVATQSIPPETHLFDSSSHLWRRQKLKQQQQPDYLLFVSKEVSNAENFYISGSANGGSQSASSPQTAYLWTVGWTEIGGQPSPCQRRSDRPLVRMTLLK